MKSNLLTFIILGTQTTKEYKIIITLNDTVSGSPSRNGAGLMANTDVTWPTLTYSDIIIFSSPAL